MRIFYLLTHWVFNKKLWLCIVIQSVNDFLSIHLDLEVKRMCTAGEILQDELLIPIAVSDDEISLRHGR